MRTFLYILIIVVVLLLVLAFILPASLVIETTKTIKSRPDAVFVHMNSMKNFQLWSPWARLDSTMKIEYSGPNSGVGSTYSWTSENMGSGKMYITESEENKLVKYGLDFDIMPGNMGYMTFESKNEGETEVTWVYNSAKTNNPIYRIYGNLILKGDLKKTMNDGLDNLDKLVIETLPDYYNIYFEKDAVMPGMNCVYLAVSSDIDKIQEGMKVSFGKVMNFLTKTKIEPSGYFFSEYEVYDEKNNFVKFNVGYQVDKKPTTKLVDGFKYKQVKSKKCFKVILEGDYKFMGKAWEKGMKYMEENNLQMAGNPFEIYTNSHAKQPQDYVTHIYIPVE